jgi:hypothetical protein
MPAPGRLSHDRLAMNTVLKLLAELGDAFDDYQDKAFRGFPSVRVQCDEIWAFCYAKDRTSRTA